MCLLHPWPPAPGTRGSACPWHLHHRPPRDPPLAPAPLPQARPSCTSDDPVSNTRRLLVANFFLSACPLSAAFQPTRGDALFAQLVDMGADLGADRLLSALPFAALPVAALLWAQQLRSWLQPASRQSQEPALVLA